MNHTSKTILIIKGTKKSNRSMPTNVRKKRKIKYIITRNFGKSQAHFRINPTGLHV